MKEKMRYGFTTGSCAAAAAKAAAYMLFTGKRKEAITILTPKGIPFEAEIREISMEENRVSCAVVKDGGDDPDITSGALVFATVEAEEGEGICIRGGKGVGIVTRPGLDQPVGNAAINKVPREMLKKELKEVCDFVDYKGGLIVTISVPEGENLALKTFNPTLGIEGGISILGTSGIVEPMSRQALLDTIRVELRQKKAMGMESICISPGNYGLEFMKKEYEFNLNQSIKCSNFLGETLDMVVEMEFQELLLTGDVGKLVKLSGGIMNTHSHEADCRMELLAAAAARVQADYTVVRKILECSTTHEALLIPDNVTKKKMLEDILEKIQYHLDRRTGGGVRIEVILFSNGLGELIKSKGAEEVLGRVKQSLCLQ